MSLLTITLLLSALILDLPTLFFSICGFKVIKDCFFSIPATEVALRDILSFKVVMGLWRFSGTIQSEECNFVIL